MVRVLVWIGRAVGWTVAGVVALIASLVAHWNVPVARNAVRSAVPPIVSEIIAGTLHVEKVSSLAIGSLRIEGVALDDPEGREVLRVDALTVRPDLGALSHGELKILEVRIDGPMVSLATRDDELALLAAVTPVEPSPEEEPASEPFELQVDAIRIHHGRVEDLPDHMRVVDLDLDAGLTLGEGVEVVVRRLDAEALRHDRHAAALAKTEGTLRMIEGADSHLALTLLSRGAPDEASTGEPEGNDDRAHTGGRATDRIDIDANTRWGVDAPAQLAVDVRLDVSPGLLDRVGQTEASLALASPIRGTVHAEGSLDDLRAQVDLSTNGGEIHATGQLAGEVIDASLDVPELDLGELLTGVDGVAAAHITAHVEPADDGTRQVIVKGHGFRFDPWALPALEARFVLGEESVTIQSLALPHLTEPTGKLDVAGTVGFDGSADVRLVAQLPDLRRDPNLRRLAPDARGRFDANVRAVVAGDDVDAEGFIQLQDAVLPGLRAQSISARGRAGGTLPTPTAHLAIQGRELHAGSVHVTSATLNLDGGPPGYTLRGDVHLDQGRHVTVALDTHVRPERIAVDGRVGARGVWRDPLDIRIDDVVVHPATDVQIGRVAVQAGDLRLHTSGRYAFAGPSDIEAHLEGLDLAIVREVAGLEADLAGIVGLDARFRGTPSRPNLEAEIRLVDGRAVGVPLPRVDTSARWDPRARRATLELDASLADYGDVSLDVTSDLGPGDPERALLGGEIDATLRVADLSPTLASVFAETPTFAGTIDATLRAAGPTMSPTLSLEIDGEGLAGYDVGPISLTVDGGLRDSTAQVDVIATDEVGALLQLGVRATVDVEALIGGADPMAVLQAPWTVNLAVPERGLSELPGPAAVDLPARASVAVGLAGGGGPLRGDVAVELLWPRSEPVPEGCDQAGDAHVALTVALQDGKTQVDLRTRVHGSERVHLATALDTPVDQWIRQGPPETITPFDVDVTLTSLLLQETPMLCEHGRGTIAGTIEGRSLLSETPRLETQLTVRELLLGEHHPVDADVTSTVDAQQARATARLRAQGREALRADVLVPLRIEGGTDVALREGAPLRADVVFDRTPLAPLLGAVPVVAQPRGAIDGEVHVAGSSLEDLTYRGNLSLQDVSLTVTSPVIRLEHVGGQVAFDDDHVRITNLVTHDRSGSLRLDGEVGLAELAPTTLDLMLRADEYPIRNEGIIFATLDGRIEIDGNLSDDPREIGITLREIAVGLPDQSGRTVQPLNDHPEVIFEDEPGYDGSLTVAEALAARREATEAEIEEAGPAPATEVKVDGTLPFWVRHTDFAVQLTLDLSVRNDATGTILEGPVNVRRGYISLLGKTFDFQPGEIRFSGSLPVDPALDLTATHLISRDDTLITVRIGGYMSEPTLTFSSSNPDHTTESEIFQALAGINQPRGSGDDEEEAQDQTRSMLAGLTAGLVGSLARREFGQYVPVLAVESEGTAATTRVRAGIQADAIIPEAWRDVVRGVYIEGSVGGSDQSSGASGGFLIELFLPHDLSTSGAFEQPDNWSIDLLWEP